MIDVRHQFKNSSPLKIIKINPQKGNIMNIKWKRDGSSHYVSSNVKGVGIGGYKFQFVIERKEFRFPFKHVSWDLYDGPLRVDRCDTLKEAKELAQDVGIDSGGYGSPPPSLSWAG